MNEKNATPGIRMRTKKAHLQSTIETRLPYAPQIETFDRIAVKVKGTRNLKKE